MPSLYEIWLAQDHHVASKWMHYYSVYERHLSKFVGREIRALEIGVQFGGSLQILKRWLGPKAEVWGLDITPRVETVDGVSIVVGDQTDVALLAMLDPFNIVIDDGSHNSSDVIASFEYLYPKMPAESVYIIEDVCCSYWESHGGGLKKPGTMMEWAKEKVDELNHAMSEDRSNHLDKTPFEAMTYGVSFYPSLIVFEKGQIALREMDI